MFRCKEMATVLSQKELAPGIFDLRLKAMAAKEARPGQFVGIYPNSGEMLLMRPISICGIDRAKSELRLVYRINGNGTKEFSTLKEGDTVQLLGVLGNGFPLWEDTKEKTVVLMGGGIGIPPMLETAKQIKGNVYSFLGYRDNLTFLADEFEKVSTVSIATEDGSVGSKGNVMNALAESGIKPDIIMACGPMPMLRAIKQYAQEKNITAYISLEERMACGVGACLGCVCKTVHKDAHSHVNNTRICTEGPVFDAREVEI
ncbi:MAG: dihydroorotate dehydrogenase electron transfer subunit [Lachnospiraceae bacterium]|nr:dihydroorotate dehydrogenase electron transfer subunit [Lachnospiraceae bacterium]